METAFTPWESLLGGVLIGSAASLLMLANGRVAGVSGIFAGLVTLTPASDIGWRALFIVGLLAGALAMTLLGAHDPATVRFPASGPTAVLAGLIVGAGTC